MNTALSMRQHRILTTVAFSLVLLMSLLVRPNLASAATGACTAPSTDYGTVTGLTVTTTGTTTNIWSRIAIPDTTNNNYLLEVDNSSNTALNCYTVTGNSGAVYTSTQATNSTYFNNNTSNWFATPVSLAAGTYHFKLIGNAPNVVVDRLLLTQDSCAPTGTGTNCTTVADTTPPTVSISSPTTGSSTASPVTVNVAASDDSGTVSKVELYVDGSSTPTQTDTTSPFSFSVSSLNPGSHTFSAKAYDPSNNVGSSQLVTVTVTDTTAPTVSITSPTAGSTQTGTFNATVSASDNVAVTKVEYYLDSGTTAVATSTTSPFTASVSTSGVSNGTHTITAKAYDAAGNTKVSQAVSFTLTVAAGDTTPPVISIVTPATGAILSNDLNNSHFNSSAYSVTVNATDASGIKSVAFKVDGTTVATDTTSPFTYTMDLTKLGVGNHTLQAVATDNSAAANVGSSTVITFASTYSTDINGDFHVTFLDLSGLAAKYGQSGTAATLGRADVDQDGTVGFLDLSALAAQYNKH